MEGMWTKMWDPPTVSPPPTDQLLLVAQDVPDGKGGVSQIRPNPVPDVMFAAGLQSKPSAPHVVQRDLLHGLQQTTWDGKKKLQFFVIGDKDNPAASSGTYPGPTLRMPRGVIFNAAVSGKGPPPHTIHWHGMEPTPMNDGVGHCSMELGSYGYQWQPNFMGFYFLHCHRNTMQHFEYGLFSALIFECPDTYFSSIASTNADGTVVLNNVPVGHCRDGKRRVACNLDDPLTGLPRFTQFPGFNRNPVDTPDPGPGPNDTQISFPTDPHAMTVPFDVEALMVFDDRDSNWSDLAPGAFTTFPKHGTQPGINDQFNLNPGKNGFFAFNDFGADYWFVTGVPVPAPKGGTAAIPPGIVIPAELNSGIAGTQISVNAKTGDTILVRILDAAYNCLKVTLPVDAVVIAWDGRALGVAPYGHNESYLVKAGEVIEMAVGRRFDALIKPTQPINDFIVAQFIDHQSQSPDPGETLNILCTAKVPFVVTGDGIAPVLPAGNVVTGKVVDQVGAAAAGVTVKIIPKVLGGTAAQKVLTDAAGNFTSAPVVDGIYEIAPELAGHFFKTSAGTPFTTVTVNGAAASAGDFTMSVATYTPGSYSIEEVMDSLRSALGIKTPTQKESCRYDVSPIFNGIPEPDGKIDIMDSLNLLRMVVGLNPC
jgi:hypothetical protein